MQNPVLTQRSLLLAKLEGTFNQDALPVAASDAFLVSDADVRIDPNVLQRQFYHNSLSPLPIGIGRKLATVTFKHEIKGAGSASATPALGKLLRACGFAQTVIAATAAATIAAPVVNAANTGPAITWTKDTAPSKGWGRYGIRVVLGGASATAKVRVTGFPQDGADDTILLSEEFSAFVMSTGAPSGAGVTVDETDPLVPVYSVTGTPADGDTFVLVIGGVNVSYRVVGTMTAADVAAALGDAIDTALGTRGSSAVDTADITITLTGGVTTVTTASTDIPLGASGGVLNMTWTGNLVLNDQWIVDLLQPGKHYTPVSSAFQSATIYCFYEGQIHKITGCMGNVQFTAEAGQFGSAQFTFTGQYNDPVRGDLPTSPVVETSVPHQVELAQLNFELARDLKAQSYSIDMGITIQPRDSVSHSDGYFGTQYTGRRPTGGLNPEMVYEDETPFWRILSQGKICCFHGRVGTELNNMVRFMSNGVQLSAINYADRNSNRVYDMSMQFVSNIGDDELRIVFPTT
jgi:hypothetical protein